MDDRDREEVDRASRGRRIFDALRRRPEDDQPEDPPLEDSGTTRTMADSALGERGPEGANGSAASPPSAAAAAPEAPRGPEPGPASEVAAPPPDEPAPSPEPDRPPDTPLPGAAALESHLDAPPPTPAVPAAPPQSSPPVEPDLPVEPETGARDAGPEQAVAPSAEEPLERLPLPRVLAIANQKGGVGKTTTAVNLGAALAELGYRVLIVDLDPQGNATTGVGIDIRNLAGTLYESLMGDTPLEDCVEPTSVRNLFIAPSNMELAGAEIELVPMFSRELKLRRAIEGAKPDYDFVLIDCPPSLGLLTVNGLAAADDVIVPIQCEYYALEGLGQLVNNVNLVRANLNPVLDIRGIVLTMYDARTKLADQVVDEVRAHFANKVFKTVVPRTVRLSEAPSFGQPIIVFDASSRGAEAYRSLARELADRVDGRPQGTSSDDTGDTGAPGDPDESGPEGADSGHPQEPTGSPTG